ncbi:peroxiredoxin [Candidatus Chrysopegis kryptomonas]|uniref:thioredoxin-dependent peroxiredoxin n=1 Tax=Candidatus Chryseopegocella kryptomonas TaxID=1633643 RepID=A0A0P1MUD2_9BACT|nr:peroxiredoxin [Candidatus Chrysopegis kryptomonas]CUS99250.1 peroxiredoxin Q/BCP [Candidatus Chrysopegis kryptomonas]
MLKPGDRIPNFSGMCTDGRIITSDDLKGKWTVLFFYPKAFTPGCTKEICNIRDGYGFLSKYDVNVLGVSKDDVETQKKFKERYNFPYEMIADENANVIKAFGVSGILGFAKRVTFIINPDGEIAYVIDKVKVSEHYRQIIDALEKVLKPN